MLTSELAAHGPGSMGPRMLGEACALGAACCWSGSIVLFKRSEGISPQGMNLFKNVVALVLLALTLLVMGGRIDTERSPADWLALIASGVLGLTLADTLIFMALRRLGAGLLAIVDCTYAPTVVLMSVLFLGESLGAALFIGASLVLGGVIAATLDRPSQPNIAEPADTSKERAAEVRGRGLGILVGVLGIAAMGLGIVLSKPILARSSLVEVTLVRLAAGVGGQLVWMLVVPSQRIALQALRPRPEWRTLAPAAVLGSYVSMLLWLGGFKWAPASNAAVLNQMASVFTLILARVVLGEALTTRRIVGAGLAIAGALVIVLA
ncbi:MAG: EamA family transporter [Myxococcales bacterium]|nr:EamA family transporter [Myxococcales bacterium]